MNLYELNQAGYSNLPNLTKSAIAKKAEDITLFLAANPAKYYMLLNVDGKYYTVFHKQDCKVSPLIDSLLDIVKSLGDLKGIDWNKENNILEFWVQQGLECNMYGFFAANQFIIEV